MFSNGFGFGGSETFMDLAFGPEDFVFFFLLFFWLSMVAVGFESLTIEDRERENTENHRV